MSEGLRIREDELQILFNTLGDNLVFSYPPHNIKILSARVSGEGYSLNLLCTDRDFEEHSIMDWTDAENPSYNDLTECLLNAGVIQYRNLDEFRKRVNIYRNLHRSVVFSPDTNILYHGFFSNNNSIDPTEILLVDTVRDEIEAQLNHKYSRTEISTMKARAQYQKHLFNELSNRRTKRSRKAAYLAMRNFISIRDRAVPVKGIEKSEKSSSENDRILVRTLKQYEQALPVLLTADEAITDICSLHDIEYFLFKLPLDHQVQYCTYKQLIKVALNLAGVFGFIKINSAILFGEYRGKRDLDEFKVHLLDEKKTLTLRKDIDICRKLVELKIMR